MEVNKLIPREYLEHEKAHVPPELIPKVTDDVRLHIATVFQLIKYEDPTAAFLSADDSKNIDPLGLVDSYDYSFKCLAPLTPSAELMSHLIEAYLSCKVDSRDEQNMSDLINLCANDGNFQQIKESVHNAGTIHRLSLGIIEKDQFSDETCNALIDNEEKIIYDDESSTYMDLLAGARPDLVAKRTGLLIKLAIYVEEEWFGDLENIFNFFKEIGRKDDFIIDAFATHLRRNNDDVFTKMAEEVLLAIGVSEEEIRKLRNKRNLIENGLKPHQQAALRVVNAGKNVKAEVFRNAESLQTVDEIQEWTTIHPPALAIDALELARKKLDEKQRNVINKELKARFGRRLKQIDEEFVTYYADEILDIIVKAVNGSKYKNDETFTAIKERMVDTDACQARFISRTEKDLKLGKRTGDCTAPGSISYGPSIIWTISPSYQVLVLKNGKHFLGRINITLGQVKGYDSIIIDATEFNPQAQEDGPLEEMAEECYNDAISLLKDKAKKMNRRLYSSTVSNSEGVGSILDRIDGRLVRGKTTVKLVDPQNDIKRTLAAHYTGPVPLYYQLANVIEETENDHAGYDLIDEKLPQLEREVLNPAQINDPEIALHMRKRDFAEAAKRILDNEKYLAQIKTIFNLPTNIGLSPVFLEKKIAIVYGVEEQMPENLAGAIHVDGSNLYDLS